jgi:hypothetical protein
MFEVTEMQCLRRVTALLYEILSGTTPTPAAVFCVLSLSSFARSVLLRFTTQPLPYYSSIRSSSFTTSFEAENVEIMEAKAAAKRIPAAKLTAKEIDKEKMQRIKDAKAMKLFHKKMVSLGSTPNARFVEPNAQGMNGSMERYDSTQIGTPNKRFEKYKSPQCPRTSYPKKNERTVDKPPYKKLTNQEWNYYTQEVAKRDERREAARKAKERYMQQGR